MNPVIFALAIGEFFSATGEVELEVLIYLIFPLDVIQAFAEEASDNGIAYAAPGFFPLEHLGREILCGRGCLIQPESNWTSALTRTEEDRYSF